MDKAGILFVDDEANLLDGLENQFRKMFSVSTALSGPEGLECLQSAETPYAVVVSDMRMPGMDGVTFLRAVREQYPDTVRVMLTGNADIETAIGAVNEGHIFRFVTKPCPSDLMQKTLEASVRQYELIRAERDLLENTLKGAVKVLVDVLSLTNPSAFSRASRIREYVLHICRELNLADTWSYEVGAMLSQIGYVVVPPDTVEKVMTGEELTENESKIVESQLQVAVGLIESIPRLEIISRMVCDMQQSFDLLKKNEGWQKNVGLFGAQLLKVANDFDLLIVAGLTPDDAVERMAKQSGRYYPSLLVPLRKVTPPAREQSVVVMKIMGLREGMVLADDVRTKEGALVITKGQEINSVVHRRLENFASQGIIPELVRVYSA